MSGRNRLFFAAVLTMFLAAACKPLPGDIYIVNGRVVYARACGPLCLSTELVPLPGIDGSTFHTVVIDGIAFGADAGRIYYYGTPVSNDPENFRLLVKGTSKTTQFADDSLLFFRDRARVYGKNIAGDYAEVSGANPNTFEAIDALWSRDDKDYYYENLPLHVRDFPNFQILEESWAKDGKTCYYGSSAVTGADISTFVIVVADADACAKDKRHVYYEGHVVQDADPASFVQLNYYSGRDKHNHYILTAGTSTPLTGEPNKQVR